VSAAKSSEQAEGQDGGRKLGKLMLPLFAALNLFVLGGGVFLVFKGTIGFKPPTMREPQAIKELRAERMDVLGLVERVMYTMPPFTVNLSGQPRRLIRVEMTFEMLDKEGFEEIVRNNPRARDEIVRILNRKTFDDVETIQGKLKLKDEIAVTLNQALRKGVVKDIYFNDFIVQ
jgi:flagellar FliL protein